MVYPEMSDGCCGDGLDAGALEQRHRRVHFDQSTCGVSQRHADPLRGALRGYPDRVAPAQSGDAHFRIDGRCGLAEPCGESGLPASALPGQGRRSEHGVDVGVFTQ